MKRPLVFVVVLFAAGIACADKIWLSFEALGIGTLFVVFVCALLLKYERWFYIAVSFLIFLLGVVSWRNNLILASNHIVRIVGDPYAIWYTLKGRVAREPQLINGKTKFILTVDTIRDGNQTYQGTGKVAVWVRPAFKAGYGDELLLRGRMRRPWRNAREGSYIVTVDSLRQIRKVHAHRGFSVKKIALATKHSIGKIFHGYLSPIPASIVYAMILGERNYIPASISRIMIKSGTVHILVVSGFMVGIVVAMLLMILKVVRVPRRVRIGILVPSVMGYCLMTGASTPVVRATIMAVFIMLGVWLRREPQVHNAWALAAFAILMGNPRQLFEIGFQLSFVSVIAIVSVYPWLKTIIPSKVSVKRPCRLLIEGFMVSSAAWVGTAPLIAYHFKFFSPVTVLANIVVLPLATLIAMAGFSLVISAGLCPPLASFCAYALEGMAAALVRLNELLITLPYAYFSW
ncbi:MAG: ComEC family competence protein [Candidatus Omnitrophica bacterium]|nr:ComEC family competence protein [Candidatus Omnitrophota bacterium]